MTTVAQMLRDKAHVAFDSDPKMNFFISSVTREQTIELVAAREVFDALQPAITHADEDFIRGPQWAIVNRETLIRGRSVGTVLLAPQAPLGAPPTIDYARSLWTLMVSAHLEGYSLVEFLLAVPRSRVELGLALGPGGFQLPSSFPVVPV